MHFVTFFVNSRESAIKSKSRLVNTEYRQIVWERSTRKNLFQPWYHIIHCFTVVIRFSVAKTKSVSFSPRPATVKSIKFQIYWVSFWKGFSEKRPQRFQCMPVDDNNDDDCDERLLFALSLAAISYRVHIFRGRVAAAHIIIHPSIPRKLKSFQKSVSICHRLCIRYELWAIAWWNWILMLISFRIVWMWFALGKFSWRQSILLVCVCSTGAKMS